ncbi:serine/threonine protein kinase [Paraburkholderia atlantica]|uniref:hypothetical protein n=1 Tax=Paraburkholderia atlantica TaxID=2654982 RepID=UPI0016108454|nr:hypothetical protein [Paraburkholderia atlantica]MBB5417888.1 serine/threonine protein kinase [Paraburkholderia atlantica]
MSNEATPTRIGKYRIDRVLGTGAMGVVSLVFDPHLERPVALKTVRRELLASGDSSGDMLRPTGRSLHQRRRAAPPIPARSRFIRLASTNRTLVH